MKKNNGFIQVIIIIIILLLLLVIGILAINVFSDELDLNEGVEEFSNEIANTIQTSVSEINNKIDNKNNTHSSSSEELDKLLNNINSTNSNSNSAGSQNIVPVSNIYFYNQLNDWSKIIYTALYNNKDNMKSGTYKVQINDKISELLKQENGAELLEEYYQSAVEAYIYDNPDVFYLDVNKLYINIETTKKLLSTTYNVYLDNGEQSSYLSEGYYSKEQIEECEKQLENETEIILANNTGTSYQRIKGIHDYLVENLKYDQSMSKNNIYNIYGAIVQKECVCEGYAKAYKYLLNKAGIETTIVIGEAKNTEGEIEAHAWNYVYLDNNWYAVDVTWDDPIVIGGGKASRNSKYKYFLKGYDTMNEDHIPSGYFTDEGMEFTYPNLSQVDYD